jgi:CubicO group peptidase (beta-lactamase class C family)
VLGAVIEQVQGQPLDVAIKTLVTGPLAMHNTAFALAPQQEVATAYVNDQPEPHRLQEGSLQPFENTVGICYSPSRVYNSQAYPSGGAGMVGTGRYDAPA